MTLQTRLACSARLSFTVHLLLHRKRDKRVIHHLTEAYNLVLGEPIRWKWFTAFGVSLYALCRMIEVLLKCVMTVARLEGDDDRHAETPPSKSRTKGALPSRSGRQIPQKLVRSGTFPARREA